MLPLEKDSFASWLVLVCAFLSQIMLGGICLNGGIFLIIFGETFHSDPVDTSWLCSLPITLWFFGSPVGSFMTNRFGYRKCSLIGAIIASTGVSLGYFATGTPFLFVSHGFLTGLGFGINYMGCMAALNAYFDKYKTVALGLASVGHNLGLIVFTEIMVTTKAAFGMRGMMLINGGLVLNMIAFSLVMMHSRKPDDEATQKLKSVETEKTSSIKLKDKETDLNVNENKEHQIKSKDVAEPLLDNIVTSKEVKTKVEKKKLFHFSVFKKVTFICFCISNVFVNVGQGIYILHLPSYSREAGFTENDFGLMWLVYAVCNIVGKVVYSVIGQHPRCNATVLYSVSLALTGVCVGLTPVFLTKTGILITAGCVGFFYCVTGALIQAVVYNIVGYERFADGVGMSFPFKATGNLIGGPLAGVLLSLTGAYTTSFYLGGISLVTSCVVMIYPIIHEKRAARRKRAFALFEKEIQYAGVSDKSDGITFVTEEQKVTKSASNGASSGSIAK